MASGSTASAPSMRQSCDGIRATTLTEVATGGLEFTLRTATSADAAIIAWHRARMFQDMAELPQQLFEVLRKKSEVWTADALRRGEYVGWLVAPAANSNRIVGGGGVQLRHVAPHPNRSSGGQTVASGKHGIIINVFTESEWRRRGVARLVMHEIVRWARVAKLDRLVLHASADGRTLYELTGFVATNEMRLRDDLLNGAVEDVCHTPTVSADVGETIGHSRS